ncbi:uncharacterized protein LOC117644764 [Thrips palmi]|uniref:Odorant receptor n=1 Tax=Thrips palmi TaxID=161013 RepID=A0A6P8YSB5_THRPL|nr:uncharacterized protein LOC117644764 [Thrips palmi]
MQSAEGFRKTVLFVSPSPGYAERRNGPSERGKAGCWLGGISGLYHSLTDSTAAFVLVYDTIFLMRYRRELLSYVQEAVELAMEIEELMAPSKLQEMEKDILNTAHLLQFIFTAGAVHAFVTFFLFLVPTIVNGESPSPLIERNILPPYASTTLYFFQDLFVFIGDSCYVLVEYVHLGTTLAASLMFRMLAAKFNSESLSDQQLRHLVVLHQRLVDNNKALQQRLSGVTLVLMSCVISGLVTSTMSLMAPDTVMYMYLIMPTLVFMIALKCSVADELLSWSAALADAVYASPWLGSPQSFRLMILTVLTRAQRPQIVAVRFLGRLDRPIASEIFKRWYTFVQVLSEYREK